ncbi:MAG: NUDIX domain-containing protein [Patescibacteria group bacterium]
MNTTCFDIEGNSYTVDSTQLKFRPAIYGVIVSDGKILLSPQWDGYDFPGGAIELGETNEQALIREVKEETGLLVEVGRLIHCHESFFKLPFVGSFVHSIHIYHQCKVIGGTLSTKYFDEHEKQYASLACWKDLSEAGNLKFYSSSDVMQILSRIL